MAKSKWEQTVARTRRMLQIAKAREKAQKARCQRCVWSSRLTGVMNCLFPRCVNPGKGNE